ncbi:hypothetical protein RMSM_05803 [Rhodopirellula maiorica SM1]|uniref:Uncharacterized protein n=1 Tax=Rhodopirellula maiorica SM1 TaxID=1265738 RepID=M5RD06_9BACT|nr:hypothetical protein RMSM_05803 [Rhodopirellula maiorica SM1]
MVLLPDIFLSSIFLPVCGTTLRRCREKASRVSGVVVLPKAALATEFGRKMKGQENGLSHDGSAS